MAQIQLSMCDDALYVFASMYDGKIFSVYDDHWLNYYFNQSKAAGHFLWLNYLQKLLNILASETSI